MDIRSEETYGSVKVIRRADYAWGVTDLEGNIIVPFGKYDWIDGFDQGLARVKIGKAPNNQPDNGNKWGIINESGEEVLPVEYDEIWNFLGKNRYSTRVVMDGEEDEVFFHDLNPELPVRGKSAMDEWLEEETHYSSFYEPRHYEEFAGTYAQDVAGYSDEEIYDAFDGEPDAYWNID